MENTEISNNELTNINPIEIQKEIQENLVVDSEKNKIAETLMQENQDENTQKPPIPEEIKTETPEINSTINTSAVDGTSKSNDTTNNEVTPSNSESSTNAKNTEKTPELITRKSSKNLSKEERLKRQRELRKKRILESSHERLSRITKTYSQGSSYYDSEKDDSSLSRESSIRSIHHHGMERTPSKTSINSATKIQEENNTQLLNEPENINNNDLSRNNSVNSINSINSKSETTSRNNSGIYDSEIVQTKEVSTNNSNVNTEANTNIKNTEANDFSRMLFREMLKEEFNKSNTNNGQSYGQFSNATPINNIHDIKNNMDALLTSDKPFEALGKMFDFLNVDEKTSEEQKIAEEKYNQYCSISKFIHTIVIYIYSMIVIYVSLVAVHEDAKENSFSTIKYFFYRLANMDTLSQNKSIFGMTPWSCLVLLEITLLSGQIGYQYAFNIKKGISKQLDLLPIPILNKFISLVNQYKLYIEILVNDLFLYLFLIGISVSVGKIFY
ncbi:hypothetical protein BCR36DRAFT_350496 [Piromyces finnis]|uniref:Uncharacterized protein n=1 Tax=Piromyces finnis TaxID=1754191 RepID=A0A1Y1VC02_9FUNG|nr:hypothetical protein BCR36DRAFT_350496 [Piromyces finnis]|eukprot:ORX52190.1 hypothetical protein BCR36DRAFT_350496 [Piromyces finnis]